MTLIGNVAFIPLIGWLASIPVGVAAAAGIVALAGTTILQLALAPLPIAHLCLAAYSCEGGGLTQ